MTPTTNAAENVSQTFSIAKAPQSINVGTTEPKHFGDADFELTASATSDLAGRTRRTSGPARSARRPRRRTCTSRGAGSCAITASQAGDSNYQPADDVVRSFAIGKADQTITFDAIGDKTYGDADFDLGAPPPRPGLAVAVPRGR